MIKYRLALSLILALLQAGFCLASVSLENGFTHPPDSARPWVYWFWLNGNITRDGITADLEAMKRVGIGGVLIMEVDQGAPVGPVGFMSNEWRTMFSHVVAEADRLGLQVNMNNDAGWNGSGGPWITAEQSMQKVVFTEAEVEGPERVEAALKQPEAVAGFYRDIAVLAFPSVGAYRIPGIEHKAAYLIGGVGFPSSAKAAPEAVIPRERVLDISASMDASGRLVWDAPEGRWTVVRFGHTSTGVTNSPSPASGRGLESDKLSKEGAEASFNGMMATLASDNRALAGKSLVATHVDSWENGSQNWTRRMPEEFAARRGYQIIPFLPVYTGRVVGSLEISERFLWDLRRTISELVVENYAGHTRELAHNAGLRFTIEAYGSPCDNLPYAGQCDEPMGEFWTPTGAMETCRGMASAAHIYGKPIVGAEAFTSGDQERWREHPATLKALGDQAFCEGINRFVFHRYAMQPWDPPYYPGMTMGPWGQHYERTQTWWNQSAPWHEYLSRCQFMLRQGRFSADICFLQPETPPQGIGQRQVIGYGWDECPAEAVLTRMSVKDGWITLPDGMRYRVLVLPESRVMTPRLLARIRDLVAAGATVIGPPPQSSPSLSGHPACDQEVRRIADEVWGDCDGQKVTQRRYCRGRVVWGIEPARWLRQSGVEADFMAPQAFRWIHRTTSDAEIYFVANSQRHPLTATGVFRVAGMVPELWWPDSGRAEAAPAYRNGGGVTRVLLQLPPSGSVFVVFRRASRQIGAVVSVSRDGRALLSVDGRPGQRVVVRSAVYGVPGDASRSRDVRRRVQEYADSGQFPILVSQLAQGDDPAPGVVKTLSVRYAIGGLELGVHGLDGSMLQLARQTGKVAIQRARYGILDDPARTRDVTDLLRRMVDAGETTFAVSRAASEGDPAYMVVKTLEIEYTLDGEPRTARGLDPEIIALAPEHGEAEPPCALGAGPLGVRLLARETGRYRVTLESGRTQDCAAVLPEPMALAGPWEAQFPPGWGAPDSVTLDRLISLSEHPDPGVRYFSGTAAYRTRFQVPAEWLGVGRRVMLDLGEVQVMARVRLNGRSAGILWKPAYVVDVTGDIRPGVNELEVRVTNLWPSRMVGDEFLAEDSKRNPDGTLKAWPDWVTEGKPSPAGRFTFTAWRLWRKDTPLPRSGLIGPVTLRTVQEFIVR